VGKKQIISNLRNKIGYEVEVTKLKKVEEITKLHVDYEKIS